MLGDKTPANPVELKVLQTTKKENNAKINVKRSMHNVQTCNSKK
jgi:hypothetical protein